MNKTRTPKERMLRHIREALIEKVENPFPKLEEGTVFVTEQDELLEVIFAREFGNIGGNFIFCEDDLAFAENVVELAHQKGWKTFHCWEPRLQEMLKEIDFPFIGNDQGFTDTAEVGITGCEALSARTGSVLVSSATESGRSLSVFPSVHMVLAFTSQLCSDLKEAFAMVKEKYEGQIPSMLSVTTGPSRTADIEKTLVLGAHGPKEIYVLLIDDKQH